MTPILNYNKVAELPAIVRSFCFSNEAWIVGSCAKWLLTLTETPPRDFDLLIPFYCWGQASRTIPVGSLTNSNGGVKLVVDGVSIDVWAGDIGWFLSQVPAIPAYAVNPRFMTFLTADRVQQRIKTAI